jgi:type II secretory ATPase GspE/PulE/Tfp pilus assembly ATPase PilB-like protein
VYDGAVRDVVAGVLEGFNGAILCHGHTGSGKTHTMRATSRARGSGVFFPGQSMTSSAG